MRYIKEYANYKRQKALFNMNSAFYAGKIFVIKITIGSSKETTLTIHGVKIRLEQNIKSRQILVIATGAKTAIPLGI